MWYPFKNGSFANINILHSMFKIHFDKDYCFPGEVHDFWECLYVAEGAVQASGNENIYKLTKGDIIFHKPMELHKFTVTGENGATVFVFSFALTGRLKNHFEDKVFSLNPEQTKIIEALISFAEKEVKKFGISNEESPTFTLLLPSRFSDKYLQKIVAYITLLFLSLTDNDCVSSLVSNTETVMFKKAVTFMTQNISHNLSIAEIAKHCNTSLSGIKRLFTKHGGMGVHKYFLSLKINAAINLLEQGMSVKEVTAALNFSSQSYFSSAFKRETGKNPSNFNKN